MSLAEVRYAHANVGWWTRHAVLLGAGLVYVLIAWLGRLTRWLAREGWYRPHVGLAVAMSTLTAYWTAPLAAPATFAALMLGWCAWRVYRFGAASGDSVARRLGPILFDLSRAHYRAWRLRRRWAIYAAGFLKAVDGLTGEPPRTRQWQVHSRVRASCVVNVARTGRHIVDDLQPRMALLAQSLRLHSATVEPVRGKPGLARFTFYWGSRLEEVVPLTELPAPEVGWAWFGLGEDERAAGVRLEYSALFGGESRSGKSTAMWAAMLSAIEQAQRGGDPVEFWIVDLALTEFASGRPLTQDPRLDFATSMGGYRYATTQEQACQLLRLAMEEAGRRGRSMSEWTDRKLKPTEEMPRIVLVIDELLRVVEKKGGPNAAKLGAEAEGYLRMLLTQAAKFGIVVWAGTQAGKVSVATDSRDWFQQRVCFSTGTEFMTDAVLGDRATTAGAVCHQYSIPRDAGRGYMHRDGSGVMFEAFRGAWVDDADVRDIGQGRVPDRLLSARGQAIRTEQLPGAVYVLWGHPDEDGQMECLYVGMTEEADPADRFRRHLFGQARKEWADEVAEVEVLDAKTKRAAIRLERQMIRTNNPKYNQLRYTEPTMYELEGMSR